MKYIKVNKWHISLDTGPYPKRVICGMKYGAYDEQQERITTCEPICKTCEKGARLRGLEISRLNLLTNILRLNLLTNRGKCDKLFIVQVWQPERN